MLTNDRCLLFVYKQSCSQFDSVGGLVAKKRNQNKAMNNDDGEEQNNGRNSTKKLSKEHYIELAAFSDSIYDRGRLGSLFISSNFALEVCVFSVTEGATTCSMFT